MSTATASSIGSHHKAVPMKNSSNHSTGAGAAGTASGSGPAPAQAAAAQRRVAAATRVASPSSSSANAASAKAKNKAANSSSGTISFSLPTAAVAADPTPLLASLKDDSSALALVAKACLALSQYAGYGSSATAVEETGVSSSSFVSSSSALFHDASYKQTVSASFAALQTCLEQHKDRRCRILACQTLALMARSAYARIRHSPTIYASREPATVGRLEDEIGSEVPTALVTVALDDADDGVSAAAVQALGIMTLSSSCTTTGTAVQDELWTELAAICYCQPAPYAPTLRAVVDEDPSIAQAELQTRIWHNILSPRLVQLVDRMLQYQPVGAHTNYLAAALPCLTASLLYQVQTTAAERDSLKTSRAAFCKRWTELDAAGLVDSVVQGMLLPALQYAAHYDGALRRTAALSGLRLAAACPAASWVAAVTRWAVLALQDEYHHQKDKDNNNNSLTSTKNVEQHLATLAATVVALRALPLPERTPHLLALAEQVVQLPPTTAAPAGVSSAGVYLEWHGLQQYRRPARIGLWTEIACSFFLDGPIVVEPAAAAAASSLRPEPSSSDNNTTNTATTSRRADCLRSFLCSPLLAGILQEKEPAGKDSSLSPRAELLLVFCTVAVETGRRFRIGPDGTTILQPPPPPPPSTLSTDPSSSSNTNMVPSAMEEWLKLSWVVLTSFVSCSLLGPRTAYLAEDLTLITAGLSSYCILVQEYLHTVGLLQPTVSVAVKLTTNACPPHILWDKMAESASLLAKWDQQQQQPSSSFSLEQTTMLMDELVAREKKLQGMPSHHLRLFLLSLAADHWVQGRIMGIRGLVGDNNTNASTSASSQSFRLGLNVQSGREIILALDPKRLLAKVFAAHVPTATSPNNNNNNNTPSSSNRRDPIKKLALETVRMCVACIENMALTAIHWRRKFGSNEPKKLVSGAVGILQGKSDEGGGPADDETIRTVMGPLCEAAVRRIQAYYESDGGILGAPPGAAAASDLHFHFSELVLQPGKTKIKPLISSTKPLYCPKDVYMRAYLMQLSRQVILARVHQAVWSSPLPADDSSVVSASSSSAAAAAARPTHNWLRLAIPPTTESRDGRVLGNFGRPLAAWGNSVQSASAASDAAQVVLAYTHTRHARYDGQEEFGITAIMRVYNMTAVDFPEGLRLELGVSSCRAGRGPTDVDDDDEEDPANRPFVESLLTTTGTTTTGSGSSNSNSGSFLMMADAPSVSSAVVYRNEVKSGDYLTWQVGLGHFTKSGIVELMPSIVYRNVKVEPDDVGSKWVGGDTAAAATGEASTVSGESKSGEDDFQVTKGKSSNDDEVDETENVRVTCEPLSLSPWIGFQPCPLVFFRDRWGDSETFRFMWFRMPYQLAPVSVEPIIASSSEDETTSPIHVRPDPTSLQIAAMSRLRWRGEAIPGGFAARAWAFCTLSGRRVLCIYAESDADVTPSKQALYFRGECQSSLYGLAGSSLAARRAVVATMLPGMYPSV